MQRVRRGTALHLHHEGGVADPWAAPVAKRRLRTRRGLDTKEGPAPLSRAFFCVSVWPCRLGFFEHGREGAQKLQTQCFLSPLPSDSGAYVLDNVDQEEFTIGRCIVKDNQPVAALKSQWVRQGLGTCSIAHRRR